MNSDEYETKQRLYLRTGTATVTDLGLLTVSEIAHLTGHPVTSITRMAQTDPMFPQPVYPDLGRRPVRLWTTRQIDLWHRWHCADRCPYRLEAA